MKHHLYYHLIRTWLPLALAGTIIMVTVYVVVQQTIRQSANDPQIQLAEDGAASLANGFSPYSLIGNVKVDIGNSLAPFVTIYDESGQVVASTGYLGGQVPVVPKGVLDFAKTHDDDRLTWQPASTTRLAAVVKYYSGKNSSGYIVAARSLCEVEVREGFVELAVGAAWVALLVAMFMVSLYSYVYSSSVADKVS